jgi:histidinol-phosphatase (PHP family)
MKANYHTHTTWCDGKDSPEAVVLAAIGKGFDAIGFSSHAMLPEDDTSWVLTPEKAPRYAAEVRALAEKYEARIRVLCGVEADYVPCGATPDRSSYAAISPDYIIGSVHFVAAPDGARVSVDESPESLADGIRSHFAGSVEAYLHAYFAQVREMLLTCDFDIAGHLDLVRKFNSRFPYFDESAPWYLAELDLTADAVAASGKIAEVNTGAISRGWLDDVYPSSAFRDRLRSRGVKFILSADAHAADAIDCAFDRFGTCEAFLTFPNASTRSAGSHPLPH